MNAVSTIRSQVTSAPSFAAIAPQRFSEYGGVKIAFPLRSHAHAWKSERSGRAGLSSATRPCAGLSTTVRCAALSISIVEPTSEREGTNGQPIAPASIRSEYVSTDQFSNATSPET